MNIYTHTYIHTYIHERMYTHLGGIKTTHRPATTRNGGERDNTRSQKGALNGGSITQGTAVATTTVALQGCGQYNAKPCNAKPTRGNTSELSAAQTWDQRATVAQMARIQVACWATAAINKALSHATSWRYAAERRSAHTWCR